MLSSGPERDVLNARSMVTAGDLTTERYMGNRITSLIQIWLVLEQT